MQECTRFHVWIVIRNISVKLTVVAINEFTSTEEFLTEATNNGLIKHYLTANYNFYFNDSKMLVYIPPQKKNKSKKKKKKKKIVVSCIIPRSGRILSLTENWVGFDPSFKLPTWLATLKSYDTTKQSVCGWQYIYIYIYIYICIYTYFKKIQKAIGYIRIINLFPSC